MPTVNRMQIRCRVNETWSYQASIIDQKWQLRSKGGLWVGQTERPQPFTWVSCENASSAALPHFSSYACHIEITDGVDGDMRMPTVNRMQIRCRVNETWSYQASIIDQKWQLRSTYETRPATVSQRA